LKIDRQIYDRGRDENNNITPDVFQWISSKYYLRDFQRFDHIGGGGGVSDFRQHYTPSSSTRSRY
jgi:hypothetical protein